MKDDVDRGLVFLAYQTSIENQFEFMTKLWINNADFKHGGTGVDPVIGQNPSDPNESVFAADLTAEAVSTYTQSPDTIFDRKRLRPAGD